MGRQDHIKLDKLLEISRAPRAANPSEKRHLAACRECSEKLAEIVLRLVAWEDNYIWDESALGPVPDSAMQKMREAAKRWVRGYETETERLMLRVVENSSAWLTDLFKLQPQRRLVIAVANPIGVKERICLLEKAAEVLQSLGYQTTLPRIELVHTYLDINGTEETDSQKGKVRKAHFLLDATKFANLNEVLAKTPGHIIAIGPLREWRSIDKEAAPDRFYPLRISDDDRQLLQKTAAECYQTIAETSDVAEPVHLILALGAFGTLTPVSLLASAVKESAGNLIERLNTEQVSALVMPIHPSRDTAPESAQACFLTAASEFMAAAALDSVGMFTEAALGETFSELIGAVLADSDKSPDEKAIHTATVVRLLYSLVLNSQQRLAYNLIERHSEDLRRLQDFTDDVRYLHSWAKIYRGIGYRQTNARAEKLYERALEKEAGNIYLLNAYATFLAEQRRYQEAEDQFRKIGPPEEVDNVYVLTAWADMLLKRGRGLGDARKMLEKACELEPDNPYPLQMLGLLEEKQLHFQLAGEFFERVLEADPNNIPTLHVQGHLARERGQLQKAEELLRRILGMEPDNVHALVELGCVYAERTEGGDEAEQKARSCFQKSLEIDEENVLALTAWADLDIEVGNFDRAKAYLEKAERIARQSGSDVIPITTTRAKLAMRQQDLQLAEDLLEPLRDSRNVVALNLLVKLYWERGDEEKAAEMFTDVQNRIGITPRSLNNFAVLLARAGRFEESEPWYEWSLKIDSENAHTHLDYGGMLMDWAEAIANGQLRREKIKLAREAIDKVNALGLTTYKKEKALARIRQLESA